MIKKIVILLFLAASVGARHAVPLQGLVFAQQPQTECPPECTIDTMEIVTWYPSPYNEYEELRLYPKRDSEESLCDSFEELGLMYYNQDREMLKVCRLDSIAGYRWEPVSYWKSSGVNVYNLNSGYVGIGKDNPSYALDVQGEINAVDGICINSDCKTSWSSVSSGMSSSQISTAAVDTGTVKGYTKVTVEGIDYALPYYEYSLVLVNGAHNSKQCNQSGGTVVQDAGGRYFCKFSASSCGSISGGWQQYQNWSTTTSSTLGVVPGEGKDGQQCNIPCTTGSHSWDNISVETATCCSGSYQLCQNEGYYPCFVFAYPQGPNGQRFQVGNWQCYVCGNKAQVEAVGCY